MLRIESRHNPRIKALRKLHQGSARRKSGQCLIEGAREVLRAHAAGLALQELYVCPELYKPEALANQHKIQALPGEHIELSADVFQSVSLREGPDGVLAVATPRSYDLNALELSTPPFLLLLQGIEKPGNLGAILRTADAAGVDAVIICDPITDLYNPNTIRSSQGALFALPCAIVSTDAALEWLQQRNIQLAATTPHASTVYWDVPLSGAVCIASGAESSGLGQALLDRAELQLRLPMQGTADSLNVATATALTLFEVLRQRQL